METPNAFVLAFFLLNFHFTDMNYSDIARLASGLLQLGVACYALRLGRFFGKTPLRWILYSGVSLLALAYLLISFGPFRGANASLQMDVIHSLFSVLLIAGMMQMEILLKEHLKAEKAEHQMRSQIDSKVTKQLTALSRANDEWPKVHQELQENVARLETELAEQKSAAVELTTTNESLRKTSDDLQQNETNLQNQINELKQAAIALAQARDQALRLNEEMREAAAGFQAEINEHNRSTTELIQTREELTQANAELTQTQGELQETVARLEATIEEQKKAQEEAERLHKELVEASRQAGMTEVAASVLKKVNVVLDNANSVSELANQLTESRIVPLVRISKLMWKHNGRPVARCASRNPQVTSGPAVAEQSCAPGQEPFHRADIAASKNRFGKKEDRKHQTERCLGETIAWEPASETATTQEAATEPATIESVEESVEPVSEVAEATAATEQPAADYTLQTGETETATTETATAEVSNETIQEEPQPERNLPLHPLKPFMKSARPSRKQLKPLLSLLRPEKKLLSLHRSLEARNGHSDASTSAHSRTGSPGTRS